MTREEIRNRIIEVGIVPVVRASSAAEATAAAEAVCAGGIPIVEVTMTVPGAIEVIRDLAKRIGNEVIVGAGTVLDAETAKRCIDAGAQFLVSPSFDAAMAAFCVAQNRPVLPGALTPTEIVTAWRAGADLVKVFPCANVGGAKYIKALRGPLPQVPLVPTGGVNLETAADFIAAGATALGVGGELVDAKALKSGNTAAITANARKFVTIVQQARAQLKQSKPAGAA